MCTYTQQSSRHGKQNDSTVIEPKGKQNYLDTVTREHQLEFNGKSTKHFGHFEFGNLSINIQVRKLYTMMYQGTRTHTAKKTLY